MQRRPWSLRLVIAVAGCAALLLAAGAVQATQTVTWDDLAPAWDPAKSGLPELTVEQQDDLATVIWANSPVADPSAKTLPDVQQATKNLKKAGYDIEKLIKLVEKLQAEATAREEVLVEKLNGKTIKLAGYALPLEFDGKAIKEFLLVPYIGACIHTPPPPTNQIVLVNFDKGFETDGLYTPVWVTGNIKAGKQSRALNYVDGTSNVSIGYALKAERIEPYKE